MGIETSRSILTLDMFSGHHEALACLEKYGSNVVFVPEGCTNILQPLDVLINKPFKDRVRAKYLQVNGHRL